MNGALRLRAERKGDSNDRVYLIVVKASDAAGNVGVSCATVVVSKSQRKADINAVHAIGKSVHAENNHRSASPEL